MFLLIKAWILFDEPFLVTHFDHMLSLLPQLSWQQTLHPCVFEQVTVNAGGEQLQNNFMNPVYHVDPSSGVVNTSSVGTKPVPVSQESIHIQPHVN